MPRGKERQLAYVVECLPDGRRVVHAVPARSESAPDPVPTGQAC